MGTRKTMPSRKKIFNYWKEQKPEITTKHIDQDENMCFSCGRPQPQRCHIIANVNGGSEELSNLHLLCQSCHGIQEGLRTGMGEDFYYYWLKKQEHYVTYWEKIIADYHKQI